MNNVDKQYLNLLQDILDNGVWKNTRSGRVKSVFGRSMRFNLKEGLPLLTTKKVYTKGVIHELLWFLSGDTNIKYLVDNNVHIWDDDAFRWFKTLDFRYLRREEPWIDEDDDSSHINVYGYYKLEHCVFDLDEDIECAYTIVKNNNINEEIPINIDDFIKNITKEEFVQLVKDNAWIHRYDYYNGRSVSDYNIYKFGDLGEIYGKQWRCYGNSLKDQIQDIIDTLKTNPDDRRMVLTAWNPDVLDKIALPACHMFASFWTRELTDEERILLWFQKYNLNNEIFEKVNFNENSNEYNLFKSFWFDKTLTAKELVNIIDEKYHTDNIPKRELSCAFTCRSQDYLLGTPFNWLSYAILTHMIAQCCNMVVGDLYYTGLDCHIYENQIEAINEQLKRDPYKYNLATLYLNPEIVNIDEFTYEDIKINNYESYPSIKAPLSVG